MPTGSIDRRVGGFAETFHLFNAGFELAYAGQVLVELFLVARLQPTMHRAGLGKDEVEHRPLFVAPAFEIGVSLARRSAAEETLENQPRIGFGRHGSRRRAPGKVVLIGTGIPRIAGPRFVDRIGRQLERGEPGELTDLPRDHLVDRDAGPDIGRALLQAHARQERAIAASVVAAAVGSANGRAVIQAAQNLDRAFEWARAGQGVPSS